MTDKKRVKWAPFLIAAAMVAAGPLGSGHGFWHAFPAACDAYDPCHYRFPLLWKLKANLHGVDGMPVSVYPSIAEDAAVTIDAQNENAKACAATAAPAETIGSPTPHVSEKK